MGIVKHLRIVITVSIEQLLFNRHCTENLYALCTHYTHNPKGESSEKKMTQEKVDHWQSKAYHMTKEKANDEDKEGLFS